MVGPCSCGGLFHSQSNSISMLFSMPNHKSFDATDMYPFTTSSSSSPSVDCTLSLGTPSARLCEDDDDKRIRHDRRSGNCMSAKFRWDLLNNKSAPYSQQMAPKASRGSNGDSRNCSGNDPLLGRRCANCDTTSTPLWRKGPRGPKSLCNACGIRFKKEERRATAANANNSDIATAPMAVDQKMPCFAPFIKEFMFNEDGDRDSDNGIPFLS